ncbi:glycoside hydrolase [Dendrothele bispora CBS 962.96]|uniref:chitinase n=1 Tax=Dendrothele bispora (strain CBS 962.96) TaxID=1314807 RepID=A0A4S8MJY3_DENBC|nr:glycoside hydrolase [Dendrothele bispora CBS 962.96]
MPLLIALSASAFDPNRNDNLAVYYGQNSYGATHSDTANFQTNLAHYCQDDTIDVFPLAFMNVFFGPGGLPEINLANTCNNVDNPVFPGSSLPNCQFMAADIQACQAKGKIVTLSLGGATGAASFSSDAQAQSFADLVWNLFLGGSSSTRPFGSAVLDGIDLDIEGGGSNGYAAFVNRIRSHASGASKPYFITAAPQCPFPDANLGSVLNAVGFDAVYVQFYNNFCGLQNFNNPNAWNFAQWDTWAKTQSPNPNVKVYIGAPASSTAAGSGLVDASTIASILRQTQSQFSSFGGAMLWDASQAFANNRYDIAVKNAITGGTSPAPPTTTSRPVTTTTSRPGGTSTSVPANGNCAGVAAWQTSIAYEGGSMVTFNGHLWQAKWWSQADQPGGAADDWTDLGACTSGRIATVQAQTTISSLSAPVVTHFAGNSNSVQAPSASARETSQSVVSSSAKKASGASSVSARETSQPVASGSAKEASGALSVSAPAASNSIVIVEASAASVAPTLSESAKSNTTTKLETRRMSRFFRF